LRAEIEKREKERESLAVNELTKDQRTVFVSQLVMKAKEKDLRKFFEQIGPVNGVIMIRDKHTNRHKGFAYVEMKDLESIPACLLMNGQVPTFQKFPILVKASEAEKNFLAKKEATDKAKLQEMVRGQSEKKKNDGRLYIGNLHVNITQDDLMVVLQQCGPVESINLHRDDMGISKGYAFVKYRNPDDAAVAMAKLTGLELAGKPLKVGHVTEPQSGGAASQSTGNWKLDDDEGNGLQLSSHNRVQLMARLGQAAGLQVPGVTTAALGPSTLSSSLVAKQALAALPMQGLLATPSLMPLLGARPGLVPTTQSAFGTTLGLGFGSTSGFSLPAGGTPRPPPPQTPALPIGAPSFCFIVKNMFDPASETEEGWEVDVKEDVEEECSKFGVVLHSYVEARQPGGLVYLLFSSTNASIKAAQSLHGRWFAGRGITVEYMSPSSYVAKFPEASQAAQTAMATAANQMI